MPSVSSPAGACAATAVLQSMCSSTRFVCTTASRCRRQPVSTGQHRRANFARFRYVRPVRIEDTPGLCASNSRAKLGVQTPSKRRRGPRECCVPASSQLMRERWRSARGARVVAGAQSDLLVARARARGAHESAPEREPCSVKRSIVTNPRHGRARHNLQAYVSRFVHQACARSQQGRAVAASIQIHSRALIAAGLCDRCKASQAQRARHKGAPVAGPWRCLRCTDVQSAPANEACERWARPCVCQG